MCGQCQKSVEWKKDYTNLISRIKKREQNSKARTKFEVGSYQELETIKNMMYFYGFEIRLYIVQPGLSKSIISDEISKLLSCTKFYCKQTYNIPLKIICSK